MASPEGALAATVKQLPGRPGHTQVGFPRKTVSVKDNSEETRAGEGPSGAAERQGAGGRVDLAQVSHGTGDLVLRAEGAAWPACLPSSGTRNGTWAPSATPEPSWAEPLQGALKAPEGRDNQGGPVQIPRPGLGHRKALS